MLYPSGINLLSNTSAEAVGVALAPVTWLFGPVATLNVAVTLTPALSALAMYWLLQRWVRWLPAAFVGGLIYGFSPFMLAELSVGHLQVTAAMVPPLIVGVLDDLIVVRSRSPVRLGLLLGLLLTLQFFLSTELLFIIVIAAGAALVFLLAYELVHDHRQVFARLPRVLRGLGVALGSCCVLLAYPAWFALAGPAHVAGKIWGSQAAYAGLSLGHVFLNSTPGSGSIIFWLSGYSGRPLPTASFMGPGLVVTAALGIVAFRKDRRLWLFGALAIFLLSLSLGVGTNGLPWTPWRLVATLPLFSNVLPYRIMGMVILCSAVVAAVVLDHVHTTLRQRLVAYLRSSRDGRQLAAALALGLALVVVVPLAKVEFPEFPLATSSMVVPPWFVHVGRSSASKSVVFVAEFEDLGSLVTWQAVDKMNFVMANGTWPPTLSTPLASTRPAYQILGAYDGPLGLGGVPTAADVQAVRSALVSWRVTKVVVPEQIAGRDPVFTTLRRHGRALFRVRAERRKLQAVALMTEAIGRAPTVQDDAIVWTGDINRYPARYPTAAAMASCTSQTIVVGDPLLAEGQCLAST